MSEAVAGSPPGQGDAPRKASESVGADPSVGGDAGPGITTESQSQSQSEEDEDEDDGGIGFFNPDLFTSHIEAQDGAFEFGSGQSALTVQLRYIHASNQFVDRFVSRVVWPAAEELCRFFCASPALVAGKRVLELGSGTGLCGITLALLGATEVVLTDYNDDAVALLAENAAKNGVQARCRAYKLTWGDRAGVAEIVNACGGEPFDIVVGTDVVYEKECISPLLQTAKQFMDVSDGAQFYLANHTHRYKQYEAEIAEEARKQGLQGTAMPSLVGDDGEIDFSVFVAAAGPPGPDALPPLESLSL